jgi:hypothetical protein
MEPASHVRMVDHGNQLIVGPAFEIAVTLPQVNIDLHRVSDRRHIDSSLDAWCLAKGHAIFVLCHLREPVYLISQSLCLPHPLRASSMTLPPHCLTKGPPDLH